MNTKDDSYNIFASLSASFSLYRLTYNLTLLSLAESKVDVLSPDTQLLIGEVIPPYQPHKTDQKIT